MMAGQSIYAGKRREGRADYMEKGTPELRTKGAEKASRRGFRAARQRQGYTNEL